MHALLLTFPLFPQTFQARTKALRLPHPLKQCQEWPYFEKALKLDVSMPDYDSGTEVENSETARYSKCLRGDSANGRPAVSKQSIYMLMALGKNWSGTAWEVIDPAWLKEEVSNKKLLTTRGCY